MRRFLRWALYLGVAAGLVWAATHLKLGSRTPAQHATSWVSKQRPVRAALSWVEQRYDAWFGEPPPAKPKKAKDARTKPARAAAAPPAKATEEPATARRVALLEDAARATVKPEPAPVLSARGAVKPVRAAPAPKRGAPQKTRVDESLSTREKKALDDLVTSRVSAR